MGVKNLRGEILMYRSLSLPEFLSRYDQSLLVVENEVPPNLPSYKAKVSQRQSVAKGYATSVSGGHHYVGRRLSTMPSKWDAMMIISRASDASSPT